jgi:SAM-dependent methyltransferase
MIVEKKNTDSNAPCIVVSPKVDVDPRLGDSNVFMSEFGHLDSNRWLDMLIRSIDCPTIEGVEFPSFPSPEFQSQLHGHFGAHSLKEAAEFYRFVESKGLTGLKSTWFGKGFFLDFGAGWGRITRLFMRDFPLRNIVGYEPSNRFCAVARANNPFVSFLSGDYLPNGILPADRFNLVVGWSVFSHLSPSSAAAWLGELQRVTSPGGAVVLTTWGRGFLERLQKEKFQMDAGEEIHWYSKICLDAIGDIQKRMSEYDRGEFVWFTGGKSTLYGEAFISRSALSVLLNKSAPDLVVQDFDTTSLPQDVFVLRKKL